METLSDSLNCDKADLWNKSDISEVSEILAHAKLLLLFFTFQFLARNPLRKLAHTFTYWLKACCNTYPRKTRSFKKPKSHWKFWYQTWHTLQSCSGKIELWTSAGSREGSWYCRWKLVFLSRKAQNFLHSLQGKRMDQTFLCRLQILG